MKIVFLNTGDTLKDENEELKAETLRKQLGFDFIPAHFHFHSDDTSVCKCLNCRYVPCLRLFKKVNKKEVGWE